MTGLTQGKTTLAELKFRVLDLQVEGTWGYIDPKLKEKGFNMLTATSQVYEFEVDRIDKLEDNSFIVTGTDYHERYLEIPVDKIQVVSFKDSDEQATLKAHTELLKFIEEHKGRLGDTKELFKEAFEDYERLKNKGIEIYVPKRENKDN